jgi:O-antigen/teichoic acid export membrane protein
MLNKNTTIHKRFRKYIANTSWIMAEKIATMGLGFVVTVVLARHFGPTQFGILAYAISLVSILAVAGHAGLSGLVVKELVKDPENKNEIMGTSFVLKGLGYLIGLILAIIAGFLTESPKSIEFWVLVIVATGLIFKPLDVIEFWFQSDLNAKYTAISRVIAAVISSMVKLLVVYLGAKLILIAVAHFIQAAVAGALLITFLYIKSKLKITDWRYSKRKGNELFSQGWVVLLGSIFAVVYLKIDQVMLKWMVGQEEVGVYAVAASLSEAWYFVPTAIVASFFPKLIKLKQDNPQQYHHRLQQLFDGLFVLALIVAIIVTLLAQPLISILFGDAYLNSVPILVVHIWAALFIFMRAAFSKWILIENVLMFSLITQGLGALANVALNYWLIPIYGGLGAAYATLISYAMASYLALLFHSKTRVIFNMMSKAIVSAIRYPLFWIRA